MLSDLLDVLSQLLESPKPERKTTRSGSREFLLIIANLALVVVLILNKQWFTGSMSAIIISGIAIMLASLTVFVLNKVGVLYYRMPVEVFTILALLILLYGVVILWSNYYFKLIP